MNCPFRGQERIAWAIGVNCMKKKLLILIMVLSLSLSACGSKETEEKEQVIPLFKLDKIENINI